MHPAMGPTVRQRRDSRPRAQAWGGSVAWLVAMYSCVAGAAQEPPRAESPPPGELAVRVELGRRLFMDPQLAEDGAMACATCHVPEHAFTVNAGTVAFGRGGQALRRNSPTLLNAAQATSLFHDGRAATLEEQVWGPLLSPAEMWNPSVESVLGRLRYRRDYADLFRRAFGDEGVTRRSVGAAIAAYERTLVAGRSRFDRWFNDKEAAALTTEEQAGFSVFNWSGCSACHRVDAASADFTDHRFHNTGIEWARGRGEIGPRKTVADAGRFEVTGREENRRAFRTPTLRNVALTGPYMHDGSLATLREVIDWYDRGGSTDPAKHPFMKPLRLNEAQKRHLEAFLQALTGDNLDALVKSARAPAGSR